MARLSGVGLLLAPGAGAGRDQAALVAIDRVATEAGAVVERMDFAYRKAGRRAPDREPLLLATVRDEMARLAARPELRASSVVDPWGLVLGGRSMGGRICSMVVADVRGAGSPAVGEPGPGALVLVSYPLHPPGRPDRLRTAHFGHLDVPCLFVSGTRDAFGTRAELESATTAIPGPVTHAWLEGKDHSLRGCDERVAAVVLRWLGDLVGISRASP